MIILHLEDSDNDALMVETLLRDEWPDCGIRRAASRDEFESALETARFDLVLSDYQMPGYDGLRALDRVRQRDPEKPFVFISGTIGEERAIDALKRGADDYVIKDRPARLVPAIRHALHRREETTRRRQLETQLLRAQRAESIGTLTGGIAHDLNNVLAPILMGAELLRVTARDDASQRVLNSIEASAQHGAALVRQLLGFARGTEGERGPVQPDRLLADTAALLRQAIPERIRVTVESAADQPILADATQLKQLLLNLCFNARDAMPGEGRITLGAEETVLDEAHARQIPEGRPGTFLHLRVSDTGTGIPPEILERIFDPFFTTKEVGKGTGLGLSMVRGIVKGHDGFLHVDTVVGGGTTFHLYLPRAEAVAGGTDPAAARGNDEGLLIVGEDEEVRAMIKPFLERNGYRVPAAGPSADAKRLLEAHRQDIAGIVVSDGTAATTFPVLLARSRLAPHLPVIACTIDNRNDLGDEKCVVIRKPLDPHELLTALRTVLHPAAPGQVASSA